MSTDHDIHYESVWNKLEYFFNTKQIPHIIFHGTSGTGKRTILHNFLCKIYDGDKHKLKTNVMSVNCAHGKGIKFIRDDLKNFAKTNVQSNSGVFFKSIVLYNADYLTIDAQSALRRCIEIFSHNTRFFIVVENKHKLFNPILSRFCEIYIPEIIHDNSFVNLHRKKLDVKLHTTFDNNNIVIANIDIERPCIAEDTILGLYYIHKNNPECFSATLVNTTTRLYENGYSAQDVINTIRTMTIFSEKEHVSIVLCFNKIRSEFRNEKMLMFYIIDFAILRSDLTLKNISFI
jgi:hypothetical protein